MLLDREADVHLAKRSGADGWLVKPLDALRLQLAARSIVQKAPTMESWTESASH
jgi:DNA-binding response OmpR family regulator